MKKIIAAMLSATVILSSGQFMQQGSSGPWSAASAIGETRFDEAEFFVMVGTYGGKYAQLRYFTKGADGEYSAEKVVWENAPKDLAYGDVLTAEGKISMERVNPAQDPVNAMAYYFRLSDSAKLVKAGVCDKFMELKDLTVKSVDYDGSSHWSIRYTDGEKEYYYGLSTYGSSLDVDPIGCKAGDVFTFAMLNGKVVVPLAKKESVSEVHKEPEYRIVKLPDKVEYKVGEYISLKGIQIEVKKGDEDPVVYTYPDVAFAHDSNTPKAPAVTLLTDFRGDTAGTYTVSVCAAENVSFTVKVTESNEAATFHCTDCGRDVPETEVVSGPLRSICRDCYEKGGYVGTAAPHLNQEITATTTTTSTKPAENDQTILKGTKEMTLDDVKELAKKGSQLDWSDFSDYKGRDIGTGINIWKFDIENGYALLVGGEPKRDPYFILLSRNDEEGIDIRESDAEAFLNKTSDGNFKGSTIETVSDVIEYPKKTIYTAGEALDLSGIAVKCHSETFWHSENNDEKYVIYGEPYTVDNITLDAKDAWVYDYRGINASAVKGDMFNTLKSGTYPVAYGESYQYGDKEIKFCNFMYEVSIEPSSGKGDTNCDGNADTAAGIIKARVLDINEKTLLLQSVSNCDDRYLLFNEQINNDITPTAGMELDITYDGGMFKLDSVMTIGDVKKVSVVSEKNEFLKGDTNCDGGVDMADAVLIMQALANPNKFGEFNTEFNYLTALGRLNGDMNGDGLTVGDSQAIQRKLLGLDYESSEDMPKLSNIVTINNDYFPNKGNSKEIGILLEFDSKEYPIALTASEGGFVIENNENSTGKYTILGNTCEVDKNVKLIWEPLADYMTYDYEFKFSPERLDIELLVEGIDGDKRIELGKIYITQVERTKFTASLDAKVVSPYRSVIAGKTFVYEKEGVGSDFTITFNSDGTYVYYEGVLSSYIGAGTWKVTDNIVLMTEGVSKKVNNLKINGSDLVYIADASDNFYYITVKDGEKFSVQSLSAQLDKIRDQLSKFFASEKIDYTVISKDKMPEQFADQYVFIKVNTTDTSYAALYGAFLKASDIDSSLIKSIPYKVDSDTELNKIRELLYCYILENNISASVDPTDEEADLINKTVLVKYADSSETRSQLEDFLKEKNIDLNLVEFFAVE